MMILDANRGDIRWIGVEVSIFRQPLCHEVGRKSGRMPAPHAPMDRLRIKTDLRLDPTHVLKHSATCVRNREFDSARRRIAIHLRRREAAPVGVRGDVVMQFTHDLREKVDNARAEARELTVYQIIDDCIAILDFHVCRQPRQLRVCDALQASIWHRRLIAAVDHVKQTIVLGVAFRISLKANPLCCVTLARNRRDHCRRHRRNKIEMPLSPIPGSINDGDRVGVVHPARYNARLMTIPLCQSGRNRYDQLGFLNGFNLAGSGSSHRLRLRCLGSSRGRSLRSVPSRRQAAT